MGWKTYLIMYFGDCDLSVTEIVERVEGLGFTSALGPADFVYEWDNEPGKEQVLDLADKLKSKLKGTGAIFNLDTHD